MRPRVRSTIDKLENLVTGFLEAKGIIPPMVDTLDMSLSMKEVNARISYTRRWEGPPCQRGS
tara:strand:- start:2193 stop:2378 length:186 start_codon:yes stop_codon:yes gene_type:complete